MVLTVVTTGGLVSEVQAVLCDELRRPEWRGERNPLAGHCYVASEALYHLLGGARSGWRPVFLRHEGKPHWFLRHRELGAIADPTALQFASPPRHELGVPKGFLTGERASRRAQVVIRRVLVNHCAPWARRILTDWGRPLPARQQARAA